MDWTTVALASIAAIQVIMLAILAVIAKSNGRNIDRSMDKAVDRIRKRIDRETPIIEERNPYLGTPWAHLWKPGQSEVKDE